MEHLAEVLKIVDAAWNGDKVKCANYIDFLAGKLEQEGDQFQAKLLKDKLSVLQGLKEAVVVAAHETGPRPVEPRVVYLIRFCDGSYNYGPGEKNGFPVLKSEATRYLTKMEAEAKLENLGEGVIEEEVWVNGAPDKELAQT